MKTKKSNIKVLPLKKRLHRHVKLAIVPHKVNQYRPHLIRRQGLALLMLLILGLHFGYNYSTSGTVLGSQAAINVQELLDGTNRARQAQQLPPLVMNDQLSQAAFLKGKDMFQQQYWAHVAPDGTTPWEWFNAVGYSYTHAGENLAKNFASADAATTAWIASPEHKENMLDADYTEVGFATIDGTLEGESTSIIVALYGKPLDRAVVAGIQTPPVTPVVEAPSSYSLSPMARFGVIVQSMNPAAISSVVLVLLATCVALIAHMYRHSMPKAMRQSWYRHHGVVKAGGMMSLTVIVVLLYSGGQI